MRKVAANRIEQVIRATNGRYFGVTFVKADGTVRALNGRLRVKKGVKGTGRKVNAPNRIKVYDQQLQQFRTIPVDRVQQLRADKLVINV